MSFLDFSSFFDDLETNGMANLRHAFEVALKKALQEKDGNLPRWLGAYEALPDLESGETDFYSDLVRVGSPAAINQDQLKVLENSLRQLCPWRKGPFSFYGLHVDSEWRSDFKWQRLLPHLPSLEGQRILDVGCGNGYHMFRMLGKGAAMVVGADPSMLFLAQFGCVKKYAPKAFCHLLPLGIEELPESQAFDTLFAMGVFYHRRSPFDFLRQLKMQLRMGGTLILETLVVEGDANTVLVPEDRYARMKNVWFLPSCSAMLHWLNKAGFSAPEVVDVCRTTVDEQRATSWMAGESLRECLNATDSSLTIEGYPAPVRAIFIARR